LLTERDGGVARQQVGALDLPSCSSISLLDVARYLDRPPPPPYTATFSVSRRPVLNIDAWKLTLMFEGGFISKYYSNEVD